MRVDTPLPLPLPIELDAALAALVCGEASSAELENHHLNLFNAYGPGAEEPALKEAKEALEKKIQSNKTELGDLRGLAAKTDPFTEIPGDGTPWATFDLLKVGILSLVSLVLLAVGMLSVGQILLASGVPGFEHPVRAYLFSFVPVAAAFILKNIAGLFAPDRPRRRFTALVQSTGLLLAFAWAALFVITFPGMISSPGEIVDNLLSETALAQGSGATGQALLLVGLLAEIFLAAGCWIEIERLVDRHQLARRIPNPLYTAVKERTVAAERELSEAQMLAGKMRSRLHAIEAARDAYVTEAQNALSLLRAGVGTHRALQPAARLTSDYDSRLRHHVTISNDQDLEGHNA
jgi:hypothetical protein